MIRSLWFKLFVAFTVLSILSVTLLGTLLSIFLNYREFRRIVVPENVAELVGSQQLLFSEAFRNPEGGRWLALAKKEMVGDILNMTGDNGEFHIGLASGPEMFYEIRDGSGAVFTRYPEAFPEYAAGIFRREHDENGTDAAKTLGRDGFIWVSQALYDDRGRAWGRMDFLLNAEFDVWAAVKRMIDAYRNGWYVIVFLFSVVGLLCGMAANWFVTGRLKRMNAVAALWSAGDFTPRISVDEKSHDILAGHSRTLNGMARELEAVVELRQKAAVADERNRVARELHDTVKQNLFALKLQLAAIRRKNAAGETAAHVEEALKITHEAQQDITAVLTQLAAGVPDEKGIFGRLAALSEDMRRRYGLATVWERKDDLQPTPREEQALLRIVQEAMNNAARHGKATAVTMNAISEDGGKCLGMADNGGGLPAGNAEGRTSGMGLVFMRERARELPGGEFAVEPNERGGVTVRITWRAK